ncbi:MAG: hypothetical protein NTV79_09990, partial [Candidatus Aureabacteria bacterium]|nr:hypothetical protein [Candidatus Auribacterota bacterium]
MSGKWRRDRWFILGVLFLSVNAYGVFSLVRSGRDRNEIAVAFSPGDERALRPGEELVWKFSEPMTAAEKVGRSAPEGTVVFDPPAEGSFTWTAPDTLTFSPRADWKKCSAFT